LSERSLYTVCIQHTYHKIITEELVAFVNKLSIVASCPESSVELFYQEATMIKYGLY